MKAGRYIPALRNRDTGPLYDPPFRWSIREATFDHDLVVQAEIRSGHRVLSLGCRSRTLTLRVIQSQPTAEVIGLDLDPKVFTSAKSKIAKAGSDMLDEGMLFSLPYPDASFDRVVTSLLLHHLTRDKKRRTLQEVFRILRSGGELHLADFGKPHNALMWSISLITRWLEEAGDNVRGLLPVMIREAGFEGVEETGCYSTAFGTLALLKALKPMAG